MKSLKKFLWIAQDASRQQLLEILLCLVFGGLILTAAVGLGLLLKLYGWLVTLASCKRDVTWWALLFMCALSNAVFWVTL